MSFRPVPSFCCGKLYIGLLLYTLPVCAIQSLEALPESIDTLFVDCGIAPSEPMTMTYVGQIRAMYAIENPYECQGKSVDQREIVYSMVVLAEDRQLCGVEEIGGLAYKLTIRVQNHPILVTGDDFLFDVTCNYANVTNGTVNMGTVVKVQEEMLLSGDLQVPSGQEKDTMTLVLEDTLTNPIRHAKFDQRVRLHIHDKPIEVCPQYDLMPQRCDSIMAEVNSDLECGILYEQTFSVCHNAIPPETLINKCMSHLAGLTNTIFDCYGYWKRDYICALQAMYECNCHKEGIHITWLPSAECEQHKSLIFVETCDVISQEKTTRLLMDGCRATDRVPQSFQFRGSSTHSTRTPYFSFRDLQTDVGVVSMVNCTVKICASAGNCEQDCTNLPNSVTISYLETHTLSTGPLHLSESTGVTTTADNSSEVDAPEIGAVLNRDAWMTCEGHFTPQNFPLFVAVLILGLAVLVLLAVITFLVYQLHDRGASGFTIPGDQHQILESLSPSRSLFSPGGADTLKSTGPTLRAFHRGETSTMIQDLSLGEGATGTGGVDRAQNETTLQICPQVKAPPRFNFPPPAPTNSDTMGRATRDFHTIPVAPPITSSLL